MKSNKIDLKKNLFLRFLLSSLSLFLFSCVAKGPLYLTSHYTLAQDIEEQNRRKSEKDTKCQIKFKITDDSPKIMSLGYAGGREVKSLNMSKWLEQQLKNYSNDAYYFTKIPLTAKWSGDLLQVKLHKFYITRLNTSFNTNIIIGLSTYNNPKEQAFRGYSVHYNWVFTESSLTSIFQETFENVMQTSSDYFIRLCGNN